MLLSEAIRLGALLGPQCFNQFQDEETQATCAMGAAMLAMGGEIAQLELYSWCREHPRPVHCAGHSPQS